MRVLLSLGVAGLLGLIAWFVLEDGSAGSAFITSPAQNQDPAPGSSPQIADPPEAQRTAVTLEPPVAEVSPRPARVADPAAGKVNARVQGWVKAVMQTDDRVQRQAALDELRAALAGADPDLALAALLTLPRLAPVHFDRSGEREQVLRHLRSDDPVRRSAALTALFHTTPHASDLGVVSELAHDPAPVVRAALPPVLFLYRKGDLSEGNAAQVIQVLLEDQDPEVVNRTVHSLWGARVSAGIEARLLAMLRDPERRADVLHHTISTLENKSADVIEVLVRGMTDPDLGVARRSRWGLGRGIPEAQQPRVADALLDHLRVSDDPSVQRDCLHHLGRYATKAHIPSLQSWVNDPRVEDPVRRQAQQLVERLDAGTVPRSTD